MALAVVVTRRTCLLAAQAGFLFQLGDFHALPLLRETARMCAATSFAAATAAPEFASMPGAEALVEELKATRRKLRKIGVSLA